jgi:thiol:disulfide interchange protein DsbD
MESVKRFFGVVLLGVAIYLIAPLLPPMAHLLAWAALLIVCAMFLNALDPLPPDAPGHRKLFRGIGVMALLLGIVYAVGALSGGRDVWQPLAGLRRAEATSQTATPFQRINNLRQLEDAIRGAAGRPVMLDFYADWCVSCKEMERDTFSQGAVRSRLDRMVMLQADVTANLDDHKALLRRFGLFGPPGIVFFDRQGDEVKGLRVIGFQGPDKFSATLDLVLR